MVLVDTSIWIEYFKISPRIDLNELDRLIVERQVATCKPIFAEVCSGQMNTATSALIRHAFSSMAFIDPDWNDQRVWGQLADWAQRAYKNQIPSCGLVDRMILFCGKTTHVPLWTIDNKLKKLAGLIGVACR